MLSAPFVAAAFLYPSQTVALQKATDTNGRDAVAWAATWGDWGCPCVGIDSGVGDVNLTIDGVMTTYPTNFGTSCDAWDDARSPACTSGGKPGKGKGFCAEKWCYVDPCSCDTGSPAKQVYVSLGSTYKGRPLYYSYATCGSKDLFTPAPTEKHALVQQQTHFEEVKPHKKSGDTDTQLEGANENHSKKPQKKSGDTDTQLEAASENDTDTQLEGANENHSKYTAAETERWEMCRATPENETIGASGCRCVGIHHKGDKSHIDINFEAGNSSSNLTYPSDVGSYCRTWDKDFHPLCATDSPPNWCKASWCCVDPCICSMKSVKVSDDVAYLPEARYDGNPLFYSYRACGSDDSWTALHNEEACANKNKKDCNEDCTWLEKNGEAKSRCGDKVTSNYCDRKLERIDAYKDGEVESLWSRMFR